MDDLKQKYVDNILECSKQYPVDRADAEQLQNRIMPDKESVRCLFACVYKLAGMVRVFRLSSLTFYTTFLLRVRRGSAKLTD